MGKSRKNTGLFIILSAIIVLVFTSCNGKMGIKSKTPDMNVQFETDMKVQSGELEFTGSMKRYGTGLWEMRVDSPETLAGLTLSYNDSGVKAQLDDLELDIPVEDINNGAVFALIFKAVDSAALAGELTFTESEDGKTYTGEFAQGTYSITFDPESLAPVKLEIPEAALCAEFNGFHILTGENTVTEQAEQESSSHN
ncbi:MAG: hypothetical protein ACI4KG_00210 [Oscillospiraceae bacterium]